MMQHPATQHPDHLVDFPIQVGTLEALAVLLRNTRLTVRLAAAGGPVDNTIPLTWDEVDRLQKLRTRLEDLVIRG